MARRSSRNHTTLQPAEVDDVPGCAALPRQPLHLRHLQLGYHLHDSLRLAFIRQCPILLTKEQLYSLEGDSHAFLPNAGLSVRGLHSDRLRHLLRLYYPARRLEMVAIKTALEKLQ